MVGSTADIEAEIMRRHGARIAETRAASSAFARRSNGTNADEQRLPVELSPVEGPAVTAANTHIVATMNYWDVTDLGSFPDGGPVLGVQVLISGHPSEHARDRGIDVAVPPTETDGWAAAILGAAWFERAFQLRNSGGRWARLHRYLVLLDPAGDPVAAPEDFFFAGVSFGSGTVTVRSIGASSGGLLHAEWIAPAERAATLFWPVETTGSDLDAALPAARTLGDLLRTKGAVHHQFEPVELEVLGAAMRIRYRYRDTGKALELVISLPADSDFREGFEFFRRAVPRLGGLPIRTPEEWAARVIEHFKEQFATGVLGRSV